MLTPVVPSFCDVHVLLHSPAPNVNFDLSRGLPDGVKGPDSSLYTLAVSNGEARDVGWGDLRRLPDRLRRFERSFNVSIGPTVFTLTVRSRSVLLSWKMDGWRCFNVQLVKPGILPSLLLFCSERNRSRWYD